MPTAAVGQEADSLVDDLVLREGPPGYALEPEGDGLGEAGPVDLAETARLNSSSPEAREAALRTARFRGGYLRLWSAPNGRAGVALMLSSFGRRIDGPTGDDALLGGAEQELGPDIQRFETPELPGGRGLRSAFGVLIAYPYGNHLVTVYTVGEVDAPRQVAMDLATRQRERLPEPEPVASDLPPESLSGRLFSAIVFSVVFGLIALLIVLVAVRRARRSPPPGPPTGPAPPPPAWPPPWSRSGGPTERREPVAAGPRRRGSVI